MPRAAAPIHANFNGPIIMIGFGSIDWRTLPLMLRHMKLARKKFFVIDPDYSNRAVLRFNDFSWASALKFNSASLHF